MEWFKVFFFIIYWMIVCCVSLFAQKGLDVADYQRLRCEMAATKPFLSYSLVAGSCRNDYLLKELMQAKLDAVMRYDRHASSGLAAALLPHVQSDRAAEQRIKAAVKGHWCFSQRGFRSAAYGFCAHRAPRCHTGRAGGFQQGNAGFAHELRRSGKADRHCRRTAAASGCVR